MMKNPICILFVFISLILWCGCGKKIETLPSSLQIITQNDIDQYAHLFEDLEKYEGAIVFNNADSYDLSVFENLKVLTRSLIVESQEQIDAFTKLREVQDLSLSYFGNVTISNIEIVNGLLLTNSAIRVDAPSLKNIYGGYILSDTVEVLGDFSNLEYINELLMQFDNLNTIEDFSSLEEITTFRLSNYEINIFPNAFMSLKHVDKFNFSCLNQEADINISWLKDIETSRSFSLHGPFDKDDVCDYIYPMRNSVTEFFQVGPSQTLLDSLGWGGVLNVEEVAQLCEN